jgi:NADH dehydrogenase FAD-containing subunit
LIKSNSFNDTAKDASGRLITDQFMRVLDNQGNFITGVHAIGDCATIQDYNLPATAQVAKQKAIFLSKGIRSHIIIMKKSRKKSTDR